VTRFGRAALIALAVAATLVGLAQAARPAFTGTHATGRPRVVATTLHTRVPSPSAAAEPATTAPERLRVPAIGVDTELETLTQDQSGALQPPGSFDHAGWYAAGTAPGDPGPAVIAGHVDSKSGAAVFYKLRKLRSGDLIRIVRADGSAVRFRVEGLERWPKSEFPTRKVFGRTHVSTLRLVTCSGNFDPSSGHYEDNTIVYAVRVRARPR
jgi:sortase (surface protein transpeptidase)